MVNPETRRDLDTNLPVLDRVRLDAGLAVLEQNRAQWQSFQITSAEMRAAVGAILIETLKQHDALKAERDRVVMPIHAAYKNASETYAPHLKASEGCIAAIKAAIGAWDLKAAQDRQIALGIAQAATLAAAAASTPEAARQADAAMSAALTVAHAEPGATAGVSTRFAWAIKRIDNPDPRKSMLASEYWMPNMQAIEAEADRQKAQGLVRDDAPPIVPGVVFELVPLVSGRRKGGV